MRSFRACTKGWIQWCRRTTLWDRLRWKASILTSRGTYVWAWNSNASSRSRNSSRASSGGESGDRGVAWLSEGAQKVKAFFTLGFRRKLLWQQLILMYSNNILICIFGYRSNTHILIVRNSSKKDVQRESKGPRNPITQSSGLQTVAITWAIIKISLHTYLWKCVFINYKRVLLCKTVLYNVHSQERNLKRWDKNIYIRKS